MEWGIWWDGEHWEPGVLKESWPARARDSSHRGDLPARRLPLCALTLLPAGGFGGDIFAILSCPFAPCSIRSVVHPPPPLQLWR